MSDVCDLNVYGVGDRRLGILHTELPSARQARECSPLFLPPPPLLQSFPLPGGLAILLGEGRVQHPQAEPVCGIGGVNKLPHRNGACVLC